MPLIDSRGLSVNAVELGGGRPVVMIHGLLTGSSASWYFTCAPALAQQHRVLLYDLRGHGKSSRPEAGYDTATLAEDLDGLLDAMQIRGPVSVVGHSYGALVATRFALAHPERVDRLALVEAPLPPSRLPEVRAFLELPPERMAQYLSPTTLSAVQSGGRRAQRLVASLTALAFQTTLLRDFLAEPDIADEELARLKSPLLVYGDESSCLDVGERLARIIPGARFAVLPGGHNLHLDSPEQLGPLLCDYLREEPRVRAPKRRTQILYPIPQLAPAY